MTQADLDQVPFLGCILYSYQPDHDLFGECMHLGLYSRRALLRGVQSSYITSRTSNLLPVRALLAQAFPASQTPLSSHSHRHFCCNSLTRLQSKKYDIMSASEAQSAEKVSEVSQNAVPAPQGEGSAGAGKEVPATLNEAGTLQPDGEKSAREGELYRSSRFVNKLADSIIFRSFCLANALSTDTIPSVFMYGCDLQLGKLKRRRKNRKLSLRLLQRRKPLPRLLLPMVRLKVQSLAAKTRKSQ